MTARRAVYDTKFFAALYYSKDASEQSRVRHELSRTHAKVISAVTLYEVYKLSVQSEGREVAEHRVSLLEKDFKIAVVDAKVAREAAAIWHKHRVPMADAIIAATCRTPNGDCVTNDPHLVSMSEIRCRWI